MAKKSAAKAKSRTSKSDARKTAAPSKIEILVKLLGKPSGATIADLADATGWQNHSVRGALAGTLRKKGYVVSSEVIDGVRRYRASERAA